MLKNIVLENDNDKTEAFYGRLKEELKKSAAWPSEYLYKFIIVSDNKKQAEIEAVFDYSGAVIRSKKSSNGKYTSISVTVHLKDPDEVIRYYKKIGTMEGVISL